MAEDLNEKIVSQVEYYFGDINLPRDKFLQERIKEDDGWVTLEVMLKFKRLASFSDDLKVIVEALEKSDSKIVCLNEDKTKIRRNPEKPLPENHEEHVKQLQARSGKLNFKFMLSIYYQLYQQKQRVGNEKITIQNHTKGFQVLTSCSRFSENIL